MPVPDALDWPQAGGFPRSSPPPTTRFHPGELKAGERLLIHGGPAASAPRPSSWARRRARGGRPVRNADHHEGVARLGAHTVVAPDEEDGKFDVILELVGAPNLAGDVKALRRSGGSS